MSRGRSERIGQVKQRLVQRLRSGFYRPGDRFMSNRAVADQFDVSYQTAHRLISELCSDGLLERRPQSGTYVPGGDTAWTGVQLVFGARAARAGSFGHKLLARLRERLAAAQIDTVVCWARPRMTLSPDRLSVIWEAPQALAHCGEHRWPAVLLNEQPPPGIDAITIDSIGVDDFSGGASAAQLLQRETGRSQGYAVLAGPRDDVRSRRRVAGFTSIVRATVIHAGGWFAADARAAAGTAVRQARAGLFCCNDRLAEGVIRWCAQQHKPPPAVVGFDDAPVAERMNLSTIAIPWDELVEGTLRIIRRRLNGDRSTGSQRIYTPRPVVRGSEQPR